MPPGQTTEAQSKHRYSEAAAAGRIADEPGLPSSSLDYPSSRDNKGGQSVTWDSNHSQGPGGTIGAEARAVICDFTNRGKQGHERQDDDLSRTLLGKLDDMQRSLEVTGRASSEVVKSMGVLGTVYAENLERRPDSQALAAWQHVQTNQQPQPQQQTQQQPPMQHLLPQMGATYQGSPIERQYGPSPSQQQIEIQLYAQQQQIQQANQSASSGQ